MMRGCGLLLLASALMKGSLGCSYFELNTTGAGKEVVIGRTMELEKVLNISDWRLQVEPRDGMLDFGGNATLLHQGPAKHGFIGIVVNSPFDFAQDFVLEGMNEKGLTCSLQSQYRAEYQSGENRGNKLFVFTPLFCRWVLANFETVDQVRNAILNEVVVSNSIGSLHLPTALGFHWALADASGGSIVVEYERGEPKVYSNLVGVLTNDPFYPWHVENLNTYNWMAASADQNARAGLFAVDVGDLLPGQTMIQEHESDPAVVPFNENHGFNMGGIPGDASPRSRFVRAFFLRQISQFNSAPEGIDGWYSLAQAILNNLFIPLGSTGPDRASGLVKSDHSSWATLRVPQTRFFAFRSYLDMQWKVVDLKRLDFKCSGSRALPLPHQGADSVITTLGMVDMTDYVNSWVTQGPFLATRRSFLQKPQGGDESAFFQQHIMTSDRDEI